MSKTYKDYKTLFNMSYNDGMNYLLEVNGSVPYDYNDKRIDWYRKTQCNGQFLHHIDENRIMNLSDPENIIEYPESQKADKLCKCDWIEHMIAHIKGYDEYNMLSLDEKAELDYIITNDSILHRFIPQLFAFFEFGIQTEKTYDQSYYDAINTPDAYRMFKELVVHHLGQYRIGELRTLVQEAQKYNTCQITVQDYNTIMRNFSKTEEEIVLNTYRYCGPNITLEKLNVHDNKYSNIRLQGYVQEHKLTYIHWEDWEISIMLNKKPSESYDDIAKVLNDIHGEVLRSGVMIYEFLRRRK